jgi:hypothetical protein
MEPEATSKNRDWDLRYGAFLASMFLGSATFRFLPPRCHLQMSALKLSLFRKEPWAKRIAVNEAVNRTCTHFIPGFVILASPDERSVTRKLCYVLQRNRALTPSRYLSPASLRPEQKPDIVVRVDGYHSEVTTFLVP